MSAQRPVQASDDRMLRLLNPGTSRLRPTHMYLLRCLAPNLSVIEPDDQDEAPEACSAEPGKGSESRPRQTSRVPLRSLWLHTA